MAKRLNVSRVPVREAFRSLAALGLADVTPNRGATVMGASSPADLLTVLHARARLEPWAMSIAAIRRTGDDLASIADQIRLGRAASRSGDVLGAIHAHAHLLEAFAQAVHDRAAEAALRPLYSLTGAIVTRTFRAVEVDGWDGHERVLDALRASDESRAAGLVTDHLEAMIAVVVSL
ncbi:GntR family transcriptional regulator [Microbacterium sp.]|uniref:GntR family transcriptional regulator n=1 Tax=Microbacterium sp. TaxID=51671 RepID=UPI003F987DCE